MTLSPNFAYKKLEALISYMRASSILLVPVTTSRSYTFNSWSYRTFKHLLEIHGGCDRTLEPNHWQDSSVDHTHPRHHFLSVRLLAIDNLMGMYTETQHRSFFLFGACFNTNHFSSDQITFWNQSSELPRLHKRFHKR